MLYINESWELLHVTDIKIQPAVLQIAWWSWENQDVEGQNRYWDVTKRPEASGEQKDNWDATESYSRASGNLAVRTFAVLWPFTEHIPPHT